MTTADLLLPDAELAAFTSKLASAAQPDPVAQAVQEAASAVTSWTAKYVLSDDHKNRLGRALAIHQLYSLCGAVPDPVQKAYDVARSELESIRDDKFNGLPLADTTVSTGNWGSKDQFTTR